ncbi:DUF3885 domain-containing protein [Streptomyces malaysiensis]
MRRGNGQQVSGRGQSVLTELWQRRRPGRPAVVHLLRGPYRDVWVRFHSLPGSKRYPENEDRYAVVLERHNTILDELFAGTDVYLITPVWDDRAGCAALPRGRGVLGEPLCDGRPRSGIPHPSI